MVIKEGRVAGIYMFCFARCFLNRVSRTPRPRRLSQERDFEGFRRYKKDLTVSTTLRYVNPSSFERFCILYFKLESLKQIKTQDIVRDKRA